VFWKKDPSTEISRGLKELYPRLWRYAFILSGSHDKAGDITQATSVRALEKSHQYSPGTDLNRWLLRIAKNIWLNELRSESVRDMGGMASIDEIDIPDAKLSPELGIINQEILLSVMSLPEAQRMVIGLVYIEGYSYEEAANILDIPVGTIMSRLSTARLKLSKKLKQYQSATV